jgi:all-trans-retinol dehydrogenase (NAD+)
LEGSEKELTSSDAGAGDCFRFPATLGERDLGREPDLFNSLGGIISPGLGRISEDFFTTLSSQFTIESIWPALGDFVRRPGDLGGSALGDFGRRPGAIIGTIRHISSDPTSLKIQVLIYIMWIKKLVIVLLLARLVSFIRYRNKISLANRIILVTGAAGGVGKQLSRLLAMRGAHLVLWDVHLPGLQQLFNELQHDFPSSKIEMRRVDLSNRTEIFAAASDLQARLGAVYSVVNNAAVMSTKKTLIDQVEDADAELITRVNFLAPVWTIKAFLPQMLGANEGHFVFVASVAGFFSAPYMNIYSASKAALISLNESLRLELTKRGACSVFTSVVCPGHITTTMFQNFKSHPLVPSLSPQYVASRVVRCLETREEMVLVPASASLFLAIKSILPVALWDALGAAAGLSNTMDDWAPAAANTNAIVEPHVINCKELQLPLNSRAGGDSRPDII